MLSDRYETPLTERYSGKDMSYVFSNKNKFMSWRKCWIALAEAERELGLPVKAEQIAEMKRFEKNINCEVAEKEEKRTKHDVLAHIFAYGKQCPKAKPIIHLGATSCYVTDNTELLQMKEGLNLIKKKLVNTISLLDKFAAKYRDLAALSFTHFQPAQPATLGKRATLWAYDLVLDLEDLENRLSTIKARGAKGATGTQSSFLELFKGNERKVKRLDGIVAKKLGFSEAHDITGQTYTRKADYRILSVLGGIASSAHKFGTDVRLLQNRKELEEPFGQEQKGSSAMPYKRNPMKAERMCSLSRHVMMLASEALLTHALQWLERTLDDSAGRRIYIPEAFMATDGILNLYMNIMRNPEVYPKVIKRNLDQELPFMLTENILMEAVKRGGDRQEMHAAIKCHSMEAGKRIKEERAGGDLLERLAEDDRIPLTMIEIRRIMTESKLTGMASSQVDDFRKRKLGPILRKYRNILGLSPDVNV